VTAFVSLFYLAFNIITVSARGVGQRDKEDSGACLAAPFPSEEEVRRRGVLGFPFENYNYNKKIRPTDLHCKGFREP